MGFTVWRLQPHKCGVQTPVSTRNRLSGLGRTSIAFAVWAHAQAWARFAHPLLLASVADDCTGTGPLAVRTDMVGKPNHCHVPDEVPNAPRLLAQARPRPRKSMARQGACGWARQRRSAYKHRLLHKPSLGLFVQE
jgi:hypothetical protein